MNCRLDKDLLYAYADGSSDELEKFIVEEHIRYCEDCQKELNSIKNMDSKLKAIFESVEYPNGLSIISEQVLENCIEEISVEISDNAFEMYFQNMNSMREKVFRCYGLRYQNPYNETISKISAIPVKEANKIFRSYIDKKLSKFKFKNLLKVG